MGRHWGTSAKQELDYCKKVEISWLKKHDYLSGWKSGSIEWTNGYSGVKTSIGVTLSLEDKCVRFYYTTTYQNGEKKDFDYKVWLATTPCNYGGVRYWFLCPLVKNGVYCGKRVGVLYKGSDYFGCRACQNLVYSEQNENHKYKLRSLFMAYRAEMDYEKIWKTMKRQFYAGRPTKKHRKLLDLERKSQWYMALLKDKKVL